jgi:hypothetical protein
MHQNLILGNLISNFIEWRRGGEGYRGGGREKRGDEKGEWGDGPK